MSKNPHSGLFSHPRSGSKPVSLTGVAIHTTVVEHCHKVTLVQRYHNQEKVPIEAVYLFPLDEGAAVTGFRIKLNNQLINGIVKEKEEAFDDYDNAMMEGNAAFLLDQERPNIFTASVGNLKPEEVVEIELTYVSKLKFEGASLRLMIPTTVSPRYIPAGPPVAGQSDADKFNAPRWLKVPYGLELTVDIRNSAPLVSVESPSHTVRTRLNSDGARVSLSQKDAALDRDFVLILECENINKPTSIVAQDGEDKQCALLNFLPDLTDMPEVRSEIIFLVDCSGSMSGQSIVEAKNALSLCIRGLSIGDAFNIVCFGSGYRNMWNAAKPYNQKTLEDAEGFIKGIGANLGGTEILSPLRSIKDSPVDPERPRQVILLTDGQVSNESEVIALCKQNAHIMRIFAFGIGAGVSEHLVRGVARASRGATEFIAPGERIEPKVLRLFNRISTPALTNIRVDWGTLKVEQSPKSVPALFGGDPLTLFARFPKGSGQHQVTLSADSLSWSVTLDLDNTIEDSAIPELWARSRIRDLDEGNVSLQGSNQRRARRRPKYETEIIELGCRYGLISKYTSYVAVAERSAADKTTEAAQLRQIPIALTTGMARTQPTHFMSMSSPAVGMGAPQPSAVPSQFFSISAPRKARKSLSRVSRSKIAPPPQPSAASAKRSSFFQSVKSGLSELLGSSSKSAPPPPSPPTNFESPPLYMQSELSIDAEESVEFSQAGSQGKLEQVFDILVTQFADGHFELSSVLRSWLGTRTAAVESEARKNANVVTAVVVALLRKEASQYSAEWSRAVKKAEAYLKKNGHPNVDGLI